MMSEKVQILRWTVVLVVVVGALLLALRAPESGYRLAIGPWVYEPSKAYAPGTAVQAQHANAR
jgi:hypothetical protein